MDLVRYLKGQLVFTDYVYVGQDAAYWYQAVKAMRMVTDTRKDYLEPLEANQGNEKLYLCVQKEHPDKAYTLNMTDPTNITTNLLVQP